MTDPDAWSNSTEIFEQIELAYANLLSNSGKKIPVAKALEYQNLIETHDLLGRAIEGDMNENLEGFQVDLSDKGSPYLQSFFKKMGMEQISPELEEAIGDEVTYMPPSEIEGFERVYEAPDVDQYKEALVAFDKYQLLDIKQASDKLILEEAAAGMGDFEIVRDYMEAGNADQTMYGLYIGHELFADPLETNPYAGQLSENELELMDNRISGLKSKKASGMYLQQFKDMQKNFITMQKDRQREFGKTIDQIPDKLASKVRFQATDLNNILSAYNSSKHSTIDLAKVPVFPEGTMDETIHDAKTVHVRVLSDILFEGDDEEYLWGTEVSQEEPLLAEFRDAVGINKWVAMRKLVNEYIDTNGQHKNEDKAAEIWDANDRFRAEQGKERLKVFWATLESFHALINADPYGTEEKTKKTFGED